MRRRFAELTAIVIWLLSPPADAADAGPPKLRMDFSLYPYQRKVDNDVDFTTTINAALPGRFSYFSYVNTRGVVTGGNIAFVRSEQNLRFALSKKLPVDMNYQAVLVRGAGNDFHQLGIGWRVNDTPAFRDFFRRMNLVWRTTFQFKRFDFEDDNAWQIEHVFRMNLSERVYFSGFIDQTFDLNTSDALPDTPLVMELQLGLRLFGDFYGVTEYRNNDFRVGNETNLAAGIEYKFRW